MRWIMLFEEFTLQTGKPFIEKLRMYALASAVSRRVSEIEHGENFLKFSIHTEIPGDFNGYTKDFVVTVPTNKEIPYVETYEGGKMVLKVTIEPKHGDVEYSVMNYLEATELYDDSSIQYIVDIYNDLKDPQQIKDVIKNLG